MTTIEQLNNALKVEGVSKRFLCRKLGVQQGTLNRTLNGKNSPKLNTLEAICKELGYHLEIVKNEVAP